MLFITYPGNGIKATNIEVNSTVGFDYNGKPRCGVIRQLSKAVVDKRSKAYLQLECGDGSFRNFNLCGISNLKLIQA
jgi:hypothetical protein